MGNSSQGEPVVIMCQPLTGLAFLWSTNITISNLSLINCGKIQSEHDNYCNLAILFSRCSSIELSNLHVNESSGTGVAVYNAMDKVSIDSCQFMYGRGGGLVIEASEATSQSFRTITNSTFTHNTASSAAGQWINPCGSTTRGGGGISVVLRGEATNNTVQLVNSVRLNNNKAQFGGGLYLGFYGNASGNTVTVDNVEVTENEVLIERASSASGGGIFIGFAATGTNGLFDNVVTINSSRIMSNKADIGGGISVNLVHNALGCLTDSNKLVIENSTFDNNTAFQGSSAYLSQNGKCSQPLLNTTVSRSIFTNGRCGTVLGNRLSLYCYGSVVVESIPLITFQNDVMLIGDQQNSFMPALSLHSSSIELSSSVQLQFINNSAYNGAGIHLVGCSSIILNTGSSLLFKHNTASGQGGAIYADTCSLIQNEFCVFKHSNPSLHPDDWGVNITFIDNKLRTGQTNAIFIDSIQSFDTSRILRYNPRYNHRYKPYSFHNMFCWKGWHYRNSLGVKEICSTQLRSGPAYVRYGSLDYTIGSRDTLNHILAVHDIWGRKITDPDKIPIEFINGPAFTLDQLSTLSSQILANCSDNYTNQSSLLYIHPLQFSTIRVTIHFRTCSPLSLPTFSPPYSPPYSLSHSLCNTCQTSGKIGDCPSSYCRSQSCVQGRGGILCGNCSEGYAVAINDPDLSCIECDSPYYGVAIFLFLQLVPVLIMLTLLAVLHIKITDGSFSGFVLISQMVTLQFPGLGYSSWIPVCYGLQSYRNFLSIPLTVYSIWNLNFLNLDPVPFCIPHINTAAGAILLEYITAVCPLVFIVVTYTWIKCYNNGYRLVVYTTRPVHQLLARFWQKFKIQPSLIDTYAGLMLLSYMRFLATSVKLLKFTFVIDDDDDYNRYRVYNYVLAFYYDANLNYFEGHHAAYGVLAILCLLVFVVTPTIVLLFYHLKCFQRCLTRCKLDRPGLHALVDAYQGGFKNSATDGSERRYFAGLYLLFRFCYVFFLITPVPEFPVSVAIFEICFSFIMAAVIPIFRPYKTIVHNFINFMAVFFLLVYVSASFVIVLGITFLYSYILYIMLVFFLYFPLLVLCIYLTYCLFKPCYPQITICKSRKKQTSANDEPPPEKQAPTIEVSFTTVSLHDYIADDLYADRVLNPDEYKKQ